LEKFKGFCNRSEEKEERKRRLINYIEKFKQEGIIKRTKKINGLLLRKFESLEILLSVCFLLVILSCNLIG